MEKEIYGMTDMEMAWFCFINEFCELTESYQETQGLYGNGGGVHE